jgi:hypothetical protein
MLDHLGVQMYPEPMIKAGPSRGRTYPGLPHTVKKIGPFTFGGTCEPGGILMRFGPRWNAAAVDAILDEAFALTDHISITEYGSDARVFKWGKAGFELDDAAQAHYLQLLTERIQHYQERTGRRIHGVYCWSDLRSQLEWNEGHDCCLGQIHPQHNTARQFTGWTPTPAATYLRDAYAPAAAAPITTDLAS